MKTLKEDLKEYKILMRMVNLYLQVMKIDVSLKPLGYIYNGKYYLSIPQVQAIISYMQPVTVQRDTFTYGGRILEPVIGWTSHHSIVEFKGKWYLFYHDCEISGGKNHLRNVKFTEITYNEDGSIQTIEPYK